MPEERLVLPIDKLLRHGPVVLFLCVHNAGRSQMALGWFNHLAGTRAVAWSGGVRARQGGNQSAVLALAEVGAPRLCHS